VRCCTSAVLESDLSLILMYNSKFGCKMFGNLFHLNARERVETVGCIEQCDEGSRLTSSALTSFNKTDECLHQCVMLVGGGFWQ